MIGDLPGWVSILPPLVAVTLSLLTRQVLLSLGAGVFVGAWLVSGLDPVEGFVVMGQRYFVGALAHPQHATIVLFSLCLGGVVGVIQQTGGGLGLARMFRRAADGRKKGLLATWLMGLAIFFEDYSNALLVGSTMRPMTDRLGISRAKLAFVVDSTAAPVTSIALLSSWIGVELGHIADQYSALGIEQSAYLVFLETLPYRFYPILMLVFVFLVIVMGRDWGPMLVAEREALRALKPVEVPEPVLSAEREDAEGGRALFAVLPLSVVLCVTAWGFYRTGVAGWVLEHGPVGPGGLGVQNVLSYSDSPTSLLWGALAGLVTAIVVPMAFRSHGLPEVMEGALGGMKSILIGALVLVGAWAIGAVCRDLGTGAWVASSLGAVVSPVWVPAATFVTAAFISFATGTSYGTMGILFPVAIPLAHGLIGQASVGSGAADANLLTATVAAVLSGSVWGDHCSPISDTTVLSSISTGCDPVDHVRTQLPYALLVGGVSLVFGEIATGVWGWSPWVGLVVGAGALVGALFFCGKNPLATHPEKPRAMP